MPFVKAGPNQYLVIGRGGAVESRGSAVQTYLRPGTVYALVPGSKQEAAFELTQETKDGIPLRFKGIVVYRVTDPVAAARLFDFGPGGPAAGATGLAQITALLTHVCLGELRHAISHMTMTECIEQRKTTLSQVAATALQSASHGEAGAGDAAGATDEAGPAAGRSGGAGAWGITIDVVQVAQVFIVDAELRRQLEAEVRSEIRARSEEADLRTGEQTRLAQMASDVRVQEQKLTGDREELRRREALELADLARRHRVDAERRAGERRAFELEREVLASRLELRRLERDIRALEVEQEVLLDRARQDLRREILPIEQAPRIVEAASRVLRGTSLSVYGDDARLVGQLAPVLDVLGRAVHDAVATGSVVPPRAAES